MFELFRIAERKKGLGLAAFAMAAACLVPAGQASAQGKKFTVQAGAPVPYIAFIQLYVGQQAGFFKQEGLDIEVRYSSGAPQATQVMAAGQADAAFATIEPTVNGYDKGVRAKAILQLNNHLIYWIAVPDESPIKRIEDLKGKKVGVSNLGSAAVPFVRSTLRAAGAPPSTDTIVPVGVFDQAMTALRGDSVQALGLFDGIYFGMERAGIKFRYFRHPTLSKFGNTAIIASNATIESKRAELCSFGRAMAKSTAFMLENPEAALAMWWTVSPGARRGATDAEALSNGMIEFMQIARSYDIGFAPRARYGAYDTAAFQQFMDTMKDEGVIAQIPPIGEVMTDAFVGCTNDFDVQAVRQQAREWKSK
jgi:NitT/TauT family transport system substrate-binding protein